MLILRAFYLSTAAEAAERENFVPSATVIPAPQEQHPDSGSRTVTLTGAPVHFADGPTLGAANRSKGAEHFVDPLPFVPA